MSFELCSSERIVKLNGNEYRVEAPPFGLGLQILYALDHIEDADDEEFLFQSLSKLQWSTEFIIPQLRMAYHRNPMQFRKGIYQYVTQGYSLPQQVQDQLNEQDEPPKIPQWRYLLARYCETYNTSPYEVWSSTPFTMFLHMNEEIEGIRHRRRLEMTLGVGAGMGGIKEKTTKKWEKIAHETKYMPEKSNGNGTAKEPKKKEVDHKAELEKERELLKRRL